MTLTNRKDPPIIISQITGTGNWAEVWEPHSLWNICSLFLSVYTYFGGRGHSGCSNREGHKMDDHVHVLPGVFVIQLLEPLRFIVCVRVRNRTFKAFKGGQLAGGEGRGGGNAPPFP